MSSQHTSHDTSQAALGPAIVHDVNGRSDIASQLAYLTRVLRVPALRESCTRLAEAAREQGWTHEEFLAAVLPREVAAREAHGAEARIRKAGFPGRKTLEDFDFAHAPGHGSTFGRR